MKTNRNLTLVFLAFIIVLGCCAQLKEQHAFSPRENRYLAKRPQLTFNNLLTGDFMTRYEAFVTDQFPGRDVWVLLKADAERLQNKKESKGIYFGQDEYLLQRFQRDAKWVQQNVSYINKFAANLDLPLDLLLVPTATAIYPEKLPFGAPTDDQFMAWQAVQKELGEGVAALPLWSILQAHKDENIYFRTDHHWTMRGAYYAYAAWMTQRGEAPLLLADLKSNIVSSDFLGTNYAKTNVRKIRPDQIEVLSYPTAPDVSVHYPATGVTRDSLYDASYLAKIDQYAYFLGGNHDLVQITTSTKNDRRLLVIKDSYAHCFVPFLTPHYEQIHVLDLRYSALNPSQYAIEQNCDEVLVLFSLAQFNAPADLHKLVR